MLVTVRTAPCVRPVAKYHSLSFISGPPTDAFTSQAFCSELGATSPDGRFTVIEVECLGACGFATPILVDDDFIENVTPEKVPGILQRYP